MGFELTDVHIRRALDALAQEHLAVEQALAQVGYPPPRQRDHSFDSLARIVIGQQLSTKAAATIAGRVNDAVGGDLNPSALLDTTPRSAQERRSVKTEDRLSAIACRSGVVR